MNTILLIIISFIVGAECERRWGLWTLFIEKMKRLARLIWRATVTLWWRLVAIWHKLRQVAQRALEQFMDLLVRLLYPLYQAISWMWKRIWKLLIVAGMLAVAATASLLLLTLSRKLQMTDMDIWVAFFTLCFLVVILLLMKGFVRLTKYMLFGAVLLFLSLVAMVVGGIVGLTLGLILIVLTLLVAAMLTEGLNKAVYLLTALGVFVMGSLKGCSSEPAVPQSSPVVVPKAPSSAPAEQADRLHDDWEVVAIIRARPGDGCIRITRRSKYPLNLTECIALSEERGRPTLWSDGVIFAPMVGTRETWTLLRHRESGKFLWIIPKETIN